MRGLRQMSDTLFEMPQAEVTLVYWHKYKECTEECGSLEEAYERGWLMLDLDVGYPDHLYLKDGSIIGHDDYQRGMFEWAERKGIF